MVLADTSIWITHLRQGTRHLRELLFDARVICHPFVIGELACGNIGNRSEILALLHSLPAAPVVALDELLYFIERNELTGKGVGFVDAHLLASARLSGIPLWTGDKRLKAAAVDLAVAYEVPRATS